MKTLPEKDLFRVEEVADYFDVKKRTIYRWIDEEILKAEKIGGIIRIHRQAIIECRRPHPAD